MRRHDLLPRMIKKEVPKTRKVDVLELGMQVRVLSLVQREKAKNVVIAPIENWAFEVPDPGLCA